jgi:hypothetical protein
MDAPVISEPLLGMISRRSLLKLSGLAAASASLPALAQELAAPDYKLEIAPLTWELGPRHTIKTVAASVPGTVSTTSSSRSSPSPTSTSHLSGR